MKEVRTWAMPLGWLYGRVAALRAHLFVKGILAAKSLPVPVISVGNLTVGGTGKTPMIAYLIEHFQKQGFKLGVVSRGYGRHSMGVHRVTGGSPVEHGDEPTMLKNRFPEVEIYVGERRWDAGKKLLEEHPVDLLLADDAFQHMWLKRDLDVVLLDATLPLKAYQPIPWGVAREPMTALKRAKVVVITRADLVSESSLFEFEKQIRAIHPKVQVLARSGLELERISHLQSGESVPFKNMRDAILVTAVGRPESVRRWLEAEMKLQFKKHLIFADHHLFSEKEVAQILGSKLKDQWVLMTAKDAEKWRRLSLPMDVPVAVAHVQVRMLKGEEEFCEAIDGVTR